MLRVNVRSAARVAGFALFWLAAGLLLIVLAWVLSNLRDIDPAPRPDVLALPKPQLPDEGNAFFALVGLRAAADREPAAAGRAAWLARLKFTMRPTQAETDAVARTFQLAEQQALGPLQPAPSGPPWVCSTSYGDCTHAWIDKAEALDAQRKPLAIAGQRCEQMLDEGFEFEERLPADFSPAAPIAPHLANASFCSRWLRSAAVLSWLQKHPIEAVASLARADRLSRALLAGSHTLIAQMIALRVARDTLATISTLAARDAAMATALAPLLAPWPDQSQAVLRWIATESAFQQGMVGQASAECAAPLDLPNDSDAMLPRLAQATTAWLCRHRIGWHPERMRVTLDERWLLLHDRMAAGLPTTLALEATDATTAEAQSVLSLLTWRNTFGNAVLAIGGGAYRSNLARHADLDLHREAAVLAIAAAPITPPERATWTSRQVQSPLAQGRLSWNAEGHTLSARTWQQEYAGVVGFNAERDAIRITFPKP